MRLMQRTLAAAGLCMLASTAMASTANPVSNVDYQTLDKAVQTDAAGKVEVIEFFSYSCPHCNAFDPQLAAWLKGKGNSVAFRRIPLAIHEGDDLLVKLYYALEAMGLTAQLHSQVFHAIHVERKQFSDESQIADFVASKGVDRAKFLAAFDSFGMQSKVQRGNQMAELYKVSDVPQLEIDGRFRASIGITEIALGQKPQPELAAATLSVADWLIAKTAKERKPQAAGGVAKK